MNMNTTPNTCTPADPFQGTILLVDNNPTNLKVIGDYLKNYAFKIAVASSGATALKRAKHIHPDLILLDVMMPDIDGFEMCRRLKADDTTQDIPVIFMTVLSNVEDKVKGFEAGAVDYVTKPPQYEEVLARIKAHLTIRYLQKELQSKNKKLQELLEREKKVMEDLRLNLSISLPHELRTPLNGILGYCKILTNPLKLPEPSKIVKYIKRIYQSGLRLHRLVENSLLYANLKLLTYTSSERRTWQSDTVVDAELLIAFVAQKKAKDAQRQEDLILELVNTNIWISPDSLKKILAELLDNAFKFSQVGTPVRIKTTVNCHLCILSVTDQGRGMSPEQIANIGAYMQFDRKKYEQQGTGLGLIIAYLLAQLEGGMLSIDSTPGQGTTVSLVLNCEPDLAGTSEER